VGGQSFDYEVDRRLSTIIPILEKVQPSDLHEILANLTLVTEADRIVDEFGEFPLLRFKKLEFVTWDSYSKHGQFGLKLRLFDVRGNLMLLPREVCDVRVLGCGNCGNIDLLVPTGTSEQDHKMWLGQFAVERPQIVLNFGDPIALSGIQILNGDFLEHDDIACKFMQIFVDDCSIWAGKLNRRPQGSTDATRNSTFVFFSCSDQLREKVIHEAILGAESAS
jgi:hypothetical protein